MRSPKKPPPDNEGNVLGRIHALKAMVQRCASMDVKEGGDYDKAFAKRMSAAEKRLKKLRARLKRVRKDQPVAAPVMPTRKPQRPSKAATKKTAARKRDDDGDILAALGAL